MKKPLVVFVCTHNACRSQIAEALASRFASDVFSAASAGTKIKDKINPDAVRLMKQVYGIDMEKNGQYPKHLDAVTGADYVVTMGCGVKCPYDPARSRQDWGLEDPSGKSDEEYLRVIQQIHNKVMDLKQQIMNAETRNT